MEMTSTELLELATRLDSLCPCGCTDYVVESVGPVLRSYAELLGAIAYCAWEPSASARWEQCGSADDIVRVAKDCGWQGLETDAKRG